MTEKIKKNVPQLRFKGFSGEWEEKTLGGLFPITSAARVHKNEWTQSGVPFFRSSDVVSNYKGSENKKAFISFELYRELTGKIGCVKKGDILVTGGGSIGIPYLVNTDDPLYFKDADLLWLKVRENVNSHYLHTFFSAQPFKQYVKSISHIGTIAHYTVEQAKSTPIRVPTRIKEQARIGAYFQELDRMIGLHQRKHEKLVTLKKAMLKKMFLQNGATVPEIRFKGFSQPWEEKTLGEVFDYERPDNYIVKSADYSDECKTPVLTANKGFILGYTNEIKTFNHPSIIFDDFTLDCKYVTFPYMVKSSALKILTIRHKDVDDLEFAFSLLKTTKIEIMGHARHYIGVVQPTSIFVPRLQEQQKIGAYFRQLDELIAQHATQLEKLKKIKAACLEKMFI